jgi:hypothetical protein
VDTVFVFVDREEEQTVKRFTAFLVMTLLCVSVCLTLSCSDNATGTSAPSLIGEWNWVESCGGIAGTCYSPKTVGHKRSLEFRAGWVYFEFEDDVLVYSGTYRLDHLDRTVFDKSIDALIMSGRPCEQLLVTLTGEELELVDNCSDGFASRYRRSS